jgi:two-component system, sensor histidine kinase PhcS
MTALPATLQPLGYHADQNEFRLAHSKACALMCVILVLAGVGLDYTLYPQHFYELGAARIITSAAVFAVYLVLRSPAGHRWVRPLTLLWLAMPQLMINWMIWRTDGVPSIYFVGLHLALYATGIILPISFFESLAFGFFTLILYVLACYFHPDGLADVWRFAGYSIFILMSAVLSAFCTYFNERGRLSLFELRQQVAQKNRELERTNAALAEIKGHMIQQEKMAALGTLAAGLLHEVNNPVNYSLMAIHAASMEAQGMPGNAMLQESLTDAKAGMQRVQGIVSDLKTFAYQKPGGRESDRIFLLEKAVQSALRLTSFELKGVNVEVELPQDTHVRGDEPAIIGVLINLLTNAVMAIRKAERENPLIVLRGVNDQGRLRLTLRDNGTGIKPENLTRVFEPFFTTREVGKGLGLGLSVSYAIVQRHGGLLTVASEDGAWTEFAFDLALASPNQ